MLALISGTEWIGIGIAVLVVVGAIVLLNHISKPYDVKNEDEFEKRRKQQAGLLTAGMMGLQQMLDPSVKKAVEVRQDLKRGLYDDKEEADDPPVAGLTEGELETEEKESGR